MIYLIPFCAGLWLAGRRSIPPRRVQRGPAASAINSTGQIFELSQSAAVAGPFPLPFNFNDKRELVFLGRLIGKDHKCECQTHGQQETQT